MSAPGEEFGKEVISASTQMLLAPFAKVLSDVVGGAIGDRIEVWRKTRPAWERLNQIDVLERAAEILKERHVTPSEDTPRDQIEGILEAGKERDTPAIKEIFARLLAAALDPARRRNYRNNFPQLALRLEPLDALLLHALVDTEIAPDNWVGLVLERLQVPQDEVELAAMNLVELRMADIPIGNRPHTRPVHTSLVLTTLGRMFLACVKD